VDGRSAIAFDRGAVMSVIEFPGRGDPSDDRSEDEIHAEAFRDLKGHIADCVCMGRIASELVEKNTRGSEDLAFAVHHLTEMLLNLQNSYRAAWDGGDALAYRLIRHPAKNTEEIKEALSSLPTEDPS
jgi:hypothetical protein